MIFYKNLLINTRWRIFCIYGLHGFCYLNFDLLIRFIYIYIIVLYYCTVFHNGSSQSFFLKQWYYTFLHNFALWSKIEVSGIFNEWLTMTHILSFPFPSYPPHCFTESFLNFNNWLKLTFTWQCIVIKCHTHSVVNLKPQNSKQFLGLTKRCIHFLN